MSIWIASLLSTCPALPPGGGRDFYPREYCATAGIDLNRDGVDDLVVGLNGYECSPDKVVVRDAGRVFVLSGKDGKVLLALHGDRFGDLFGAAVAPAGDANGDGVPDLWIGMPGAGEYSTDSSVPKVERAGGGGVRLCSGKDGSTLRDLQWTVPCIHAGEGVWSTQDLDGDGSGDLLVSDESHEHLFAASSVAGKVLWKRDTDAWVRGDHVACVDDVDDDNFDDLVVGSISSHETEGESRGRITVVSGRTGADIKVFRGSEVLPGRFGFMGEVAAVQDAKGRLAVLARCKMYRRNENPLTAVYVLSIRNRTWKGPLATVTADKKILDGHDEIGSFGTSMCSLGDLDGDGQSDFAISAPNWKRLGSQHMFDGSLILYSGKTSGPFKQVPAAPGLGAATLPGWGDCMCFGDQVGSIGDVNGDRVADIFVVSWPCEDFPCAPLRKLHVYSGKAFQLLWELDLAQFDAGPKTK